MALVCWEITKSSLATNQSWRHDNANEQSVSVQFAWHREPRFQFGEIFLTKNSFLCISGEVTCIANKYSYKKQYRLPHKDREAKGNAEIINGFERFT